MVKPSVLEEEVAMRLKMMLSANRISNRAKDPKNEWQPLVNQVMNGKENLFEAARATIEVIYPNLFTILLEKYPNLSETETKVCLLSFCDISNTEIGDLLGLKPNTINQIRSTLRKKMNLNSDKMKEQLRNALSD
jgi:DNA-binding CsgD family transcriptional regulator